MMHLEPDGSAGPDICTIFPIARIHSCFSEKFGIPRQPGLAAKATARMEMLPPYDRSEMVRGLEKFSHIWIHFLFHDAITEGWRPTVRPPWLGGRKRVGVFASRSPHRPNFIGLSVVRLLEIHLEGKRLFLELAGVDFLDQTPVFDIKPYLPYSDRIIEATGGYAVEPKGRRRGRVQRRGPGILSGLSTGQREGSFGADPGDPAAGPAPGQSEGGRAEFRHAALGHQCPLAGERQRISGTDLRIGQGSLKPSIRQWTRPPILYRPLLIS